MITIILNDAPYGNKRSYNGLRLALARAEEDVRIFLMADAVFCALENQTTPNGYYNIARMLKSLLKRGANIHMRGSCSDARGVSENQVIREVVKSDMATLAGWVKETSKTLVF